MKVEETKFEGLILIYPEVYKDERGSFYESFQQERYEKLDLPRFVQDNISYSKQGVLRGFHYQIQHPQAQLMWVSKGWVYDVVLDLREKSKTFGQFFSYELSEDPLVQIYIPPGFAHAFCVLSEDCIMHYKCSEYYHQNDEAGILWNSVGVLWPSSDPILSEKDQHHPTLQKAVQINQLPKIVIKR